MPREPLQGLLDHFIEQFASVVAARAEAMLAKRAPALKGKARAGARMCPVPGCNKAGAGPRNRWFCQDHAKSVPVREQKRLLAARSSSGGAALVLRKRKGPPKGRKLDMSCRVAGCKNTSRGPRFGFICDEHRKKLSVKEQREAREKWKTSHAKKAA